MLGLDVLSLWIDDTVYVIWYGVLRYMERQDKSPEGRQMTKYAPKKKGGIVAIIAHDSRKKKLSRVESPRGN